jgi:hypothetical protein
MHEAEPLLYWRVKRGGKWTFVRAKHELYAHECCVVPPEVIESE